MLIIKLHSLAIRLAFFLRQWGKRAGGLMSHGRKAQLGSGWWWLELLVRLLELGGLFVGYETLADWVKWNTRPLNEAERKLARSFFGENIRWELVRVDRLALLGSRQKRFAYVSLHTVNYWREISDSVLIHELVHVWQYEQLGAVYLVKAIRAQRSGEGYNYGGVEALRGKAFLDFNLEQQAEIAMDYFRLKHGLKPQWGKAGVEDLPVYEQVLTPLMPLWKEDHGRRP